jgi:hypothetical protein
MVHTKAAPRLHFVLNCASGSCPPMRPQLPVGAQYERFLQQAAIDFINDPNNVHLDSQCETLSVSKIFEWYLGIDHLRHGKAENTNHNRDKVRFKDVSATLLETIHTIEKNDRA